MGTYTLIASAVDALCREYSCGQTIRIYPVVGLSPSASDMSIDTAEDVKLTCENLGNNEVVWMVLRDGKEIVPPFDLTARGGHGFFPEAGLYTFTASVTDELGCVTTSMASIQIYPVGVSGFYDMLLNTATAVPCCAGPDIGLSANAASVKDKRRHPSQNTTF